MNESASEREWFALSEKVVTRDDFVDFVEELSASLEESPHLWENVALDRFLGALEERVSDLAPSSHPAFGKDEVTSWSEVARLFFISAGRKKGPA